MAVAVSVAVCADVTATAVAVNVAVRAPDGTVTEAGTVTAELLLLSATTNPSDGAAPFSDTVQESDAAPVIVAFAQVSPLSSPAADCPVPLRLITTVPLIVALLTTVISPVAAPEVVGSNCTCTLTDCPGFRVTGKAAPDIEKPVPVSAAELIVSGEVPEDVSVTDCVAGVLRFTSPNVRSVVLTLRAGASTSSCTAKTLV